MNKFEQEIKENEDLLDTERKLYRAIVSMFPDGDMPLGFFDRLTESSHDQKSLQEQCKKLALEYGFVYKPYRGFIRGSTLGH